MRIVAGACRRSLLPTVALLAAIALPVAPPAARDSAGPPTGVAQAQAEQPGIYRTTLPNGMLVVTHERPEAEVAALSIYIRGGSRNEDPTTVGSAHFMEHMFFQGTPSRPDSRAID